MRMCRKLKRSIGCGYWLIFIDKTRFKIIHVIKSENQNQNKNGVTGSESKPAANQNGVRESESNQNEVRESESS
jgi:hypothetical protein